MWSMLRSTWAFRYFIVSSIKTEFMSRFIRSRIGGIWMVVNPLVQVCIYALILSSLLSARLPELADQTYGYAIYLTAGILGWSLFSDVVTRCLTIFIENGNLLKKMVFPKICLPLITAGTALVNNGLLLLAIVVVFAVLGHGLAPSMLLLPVLTGLTLALALGIGIVLGILNVFMRDVGQVIPLVLQIGFWFTPVVYVPTVLPENLRALLAFNPVYPLITAYHEILVFGRMPDLGSLAGTAILAVGLMAVGMFMFRRAGAEMVDVL
jgi:lipopolysaccharide transport system permease protein